jgi:hypothetical protein
MKKSDLKGKKYVSLLRVSTDQQDVSILGQGDANDAFASETGMIRSNVKDQVAINVSGSRTFNRKDIIELIEKKRKGGDFEVVLVYDLSRLTRGGISHGHDLKRRFARVGVPVISVGDNLPDGDEGELIESCIHYKNKIFSKMHSSASIRGRFASILRGEQPYCTTTPFGFDRLYCNATTGKPTMLLRNVGNRMIHKLDPENQNLLLGVIGVKEDGTHVRYQKQPDEYSKLVLGHPERVAILRWMFHEHYVKNIGTPTIAAELNNRSIAPIGADAWTINSVFRMLRNPLYLGRYIACRGTTGVHNKSAEKKPIPIEVNQMQLEEAGYLTVPVTKRPAEEWVNVKPREGEEHVVLIDDPEVREVAEKIILEWWERWAVKAPTKLSRDRHKDSKYFLKALLRSKQGLHRMYGSTKGNANENRYYCVPVIKPSEKDDPSLHRRVPAEPLEKSVLNVLKETMASCTEIETMIEEHIQQELTHTLDQSDRLTELQRKSKQLARRLSLIYETSDETDQNDQDLKQTILKLKTQRRDVDSELAAITRLREADNLDVAAIRRSVTKQFTQLKDGLDGFSMRQKRELVLHLCQNLTVDVDTRDFEFDMCLPSWAMQNSQVMSEAVGIVEKLDGKISNDAHPMSDLKIASVHCRYHRKARKSPICYDCTRTSRLSSKALVKAA